MKVSKEIDPNSFIVLFNKSDTGPEAILPKAIHEMDKVIFCNIWNTDNLS